jgi:hypothetical protein
MNNIEKYLNWDKIVDVALIAGIIYLAGNDKDGWGWLMFLLILKN